MTKNILVTGANSGIGFALCKQLVGKPHNCHVFLGARNDDKGKAAVASILKENAEAKVSFVKIDVGDEKSVISAAAAVKSQLSGDSLYGIVNNAGTGLAHNVDANTIIDTNLYGPRRVIEAFLPCLDEKNGRIVNVGSGAGPMYVNKIAGQKKEAAVKLLTSWATTKEQLDKFVEDESKTYDQSSQDDRYLAYGISKAALATYTMVLAKQFCEKKLAITVSCLSPGFIATAIVQGFGAKKTPEEGTVSIHHCLFDKLEGNGLYFGSDGVRSPLTKVRNPGEPVYTPSADELAEEKKYQL